ncbi:MULTISPECIES: hypothetical protein [unclassified Bradyrhizobium]|uniref:hypothetical protein n=1 Tax=unclassified Bradyrhizobium TaxID=2631580 RepID=UPI0028E88104|nr:MULTISPECIES: hypothetical protein [unclassified Bradyrhizobium]
MPSLNYSNLPTTRAEALRLGVDRFFTGKPCRRGHLAPRYVSSPNCATCLVEHARKNGGWNARPEKHAFLNSIRAVVEKRGGALLSKAYVSAKTKLRVRCERGHIFPITPDNLRHGRWCPKCKFEDHTKRQTAKFLSIAKLNEIAHERFGGKCLATTPASTHTRVLWRCKVKAHKPFPAAISNVVHQGNWCPECDAVRRRLYPPKPAIPRTIVEARIAERGGRIVCIVGGKQWRGLGTLLWVKCANGHEWKADANNLIHAGSWCPYCRPKGERIVREIFEATFGARFPKVKPAWLAVRTGRKLELDGYCEKLAIAFEYQGPHHKSQATVRATDALKRKACRAHRVTLVEVVAVRRPFPPQNLLPSVEASLNAAGLKRKPRLPKDELFEAELAELKRMAAARKGKLVSQRYLGSERHEWKCSISGHPTWFAEPWRIRRGAWCPSCAGNRKLDISELRRWGAKHGLRLMDKKYAGVQRAYSWRCTSHGHVVRRSKGNITASLRKGRLACSECKPE